MTIRNTMNMIMHKMRGAIRTMIMIIKNMLHHNQKVNLITTPKSTTITAATTLTEPILTTISTSNFKNPASIVNIKRVIIHTAIKVTIMIKNK